MALAERCFEENVVSQNLLTDHIKAVACHGVSPASGWPSHYTVILTQL
jgi:hypothetical protein